MGSVIGSCMISGLSECRMSVGCAPWSVRSSRAMSRRRVLRSSGHDGMLLCGISNPDSVGIICCGSTGIRFNSAWRIQRISSCHTRPPIVRSTCIVEGGSSASGSNSGRRSCALSRKIVAAFRSILRTLIEFGVAPPVRVQFSCFARDVPWSDSMSNPLQISWVHWWWF